MRYCTSCGLQRSNSFEDDYCPNCGAYLKYLDDCAKRTVRKLHKAGIQVSYAVAEVYSYADCTIHTTNISFGLAKLYKPEVLRGLPEGITYSLINNYDYDTENSPVYLLIAPIRTYGVLLFEVDYTNKNEAKTVLKQKLKELDDWTYYAVEDGWLSICNLGGLL